MVGCGVHRLRVWLGYISRSSRQAVSKAEGEEVCMCLCEREGAVSWSQSEASLVRVES
jgi:hypothetical protein